MTQASNSMSMMMSCTFEVKWPQLVQGQPQQQAQGQSQQPVQGQSQQLGQVQSHPPAHHQGNSGIQVHAQPPVGSPMDIEYCNDNRMDEEGVLDRLGNPSR